MRSKTSTALLAGILAVVAMDHGRSEQAAGLRWLDAMGWNLLGGRSAMTEL